MDGDRGAGNEDTTKTSAADVWVEDGLLHIVYREGAEVDLETAEAVLAAEAKVLDGRKLPTLVDTAGARSISRQAREMFAGPTAAGLQKATALLVRSSLTRMLGNMFLGLNRTISPTKLFNSRDDAIAWLKQHS